jgi:hypothetical protein
MEVKCLRSFAEDFIHASLHLRVVCAEGQAMAPEGIKKGRLMPREGRTASFDPRSCGHHHELNNN